MSSDVAIRVEGLSKAYTVRHRRHDHVTLAQTALERLKHPFQRDEREQFWALRDVSFEVKQGEVLGIIGRNGAGKSTLLKLLTRITAPTTGRIDLWGRVGSLLEVGTGFHPELTGRENVYLNGSILGMSRRDIDRQFDAIVDFAGVEKFLDTPVKRYSSGMYVRLAFAVAAHLETEILLVDEVLAVGDVEFQKKCISKLGQVAGAGRTVLFVSHQMSSILDTCTSALVLDTGMLQSKADAKSSVAAYSLMLRNRSQAPLTARAGKYVKSVTTSQHPVSPDSIKEIRVDVDRIESLQVPYWVSVHIVGADMNVVLQCDSRQVGVVLDPAKNQLVRFVLQSPSLLPSEYSVDVFICANGVIDRLEGAAFIAVTEESPFSIPIIEEAQAHNVVLPSFTVETLDRAAITTSFGGSHLRSD